jgi:hypothetical protein
MNSDPFQKGMQKYTIFKNWLSLGLAKIRLNARFGIARKMVEKYKLLDYFRPK